MGEADEFPPIMTVDQAAAYLQLSIAKVYRLLRANEIPAAKFGDTWRIKRADLDNLFGYAEEEVE